MSRLFRIIRERRGFGFLSQYRSLRSRSFVQAILRRRWRLLMSRLFRIIRERWGFAFLSIMWRQWSLQRTKALLSRLWSWDWPGRNPLCKTKSSRFRRGAEWLPRCRLSFRSATWRRCSIMIQRCRRRSECNPTTLLSRHAQGSSATGCNASPRNGLSVSRRTSTPVAAGKVCFHGLSATFIGVQRLFSSTWTGRPIVGRPLWRSDSTKGDF